jgi:hypothetical protein
MMQAILPEFVDYPQHLHALVTIGDGNAADSNGGGNVTSTLTVRHSTVSGNAAGDGGGISNDEGGRQRTT